ncbi:MAG: HEAT repeat domain-containing protein [Acidimicrobiales bacterium]
MAGLLDAVTITIGVLILATVSATVIGRIVRRRRDTRRAARAARLRPVVAGVAAADDGDEPAVMIESVGRGDRALLEELALDLVPKLRGSGREAIIEVLVDRGVADDAVRRLRSRRPGVVARCRAALVLGQLAQTDAEDLLIDQLASRHPELRIAAVRALGRIATPAAVRALVSCLADPDRFPAGVVGAALADCGAPAVEPLSARLHALPTLGREVAIEVLGAGYATSARSVLEDHLDDADPRVRAAAATALGRLGVPRSVEPLERVLADDQPPAVRAASARALGAIGATEPIETLVALVASDDHQVATAAAEGLASLGPAGRSALARVEASGSDLPARHAAAALFEARS